jgi:DNA (cytosine-5)-methyltransferase 1
MNKIVSLFSGAGGLDYGFVSSNHFEVVFANEILFRPVQTYELNFQTEIIKNSKDYQKKRTVMEGNIEDVDFEYLDKDIDLVIGGPPCQDFSIVRGPSKKRQGISVKRGLLYTHFVRALVKLQPKAFVFENVPGLKSTNRGEAYKTILNDFENLPSSWSEVKNNMGIKNSNKQNNAIDGYNVIFHEVVDMSKVGVPQSRRRLILIGIRDDLFKRYDKQQINQFKHNFLSPDSLFNKYPLTTLECFTGKPLNKLQNEYEQVMKEYNGIGEEVKTEKALKWKYEVWDKLNFNILDDYVFMNNKKYKTNNIKNNSIGYELDEAMIEHEQILKELKYEQSNVKNLRDENNKNSVESHPIFSRMRMIPPDENCEFVRGTKWNVEGRGMSLIYRRIHPLKPSYTVVAYGGGGTWGYHYERNRAVLTNRERARIQTFPDSFIFKGNRSEVRAQIGEAAPPLLGKKIANALVETFDIF